MRESYHSIPRGKWNGKKFNGTVQPFSYILVYSLKRKEGPLDPRIQKLQEEICLLQQEKAEREAALPAHSIRPHQLLAIEDLEEKIGQKEKELRSLTGET